MSDLVGVLCCCFCCGLCENVTQNCENNDSSIDRVGLLGYRTVQQKCNTHAVIELGRVFHQSTLCA